MAATETLRLIITGDSRGAQTALQAVAREGKQADTVFGAFRRGMSLGSGHAISFRDRIGLLGSGLQKIRKDGFGGLTGAAQNWGTALAGSLPIIGAAVAGVGLLTAAVLNAKRTYEDYMLTISRVQRLTGLSAEATSELSVEMRLSGVDIARGQAGLALFAKGLDAARQGVAGNLAPFQRLGVSLRDSHGQLRSVGDVLSDVRNRLSQIPDAATRAGIAGKLFGRGFKEMLPWLMKSEQEIAKFKKTAADYGLIMNDKTMKAFGEYRKNQRLLSLGWDAIKVNAFAALVPLVNWLMPGINKAIQVAAGWIGRFRRAVEKKGWANALMEMNPVLGQIWDKLKKAWNWAKNFGAYIIEHRGEIADAFRTILSIVEDIAAVINAAVDAAHYLGTLVGSKPKHTGGKGYKGKGRAFAEGGVVTSPTVALVGEAGAEAIVPLTSPSRAAAVLAEAGLMTNTSNSTALNIHIGQVMGTDRRAAQQLAQMVGDTLMSGVLRRMVGQNA